MLTSRTSRTRTVLRGLATGPAVALLAVTTVALTPTAASATDTRTSVRQYEAQLVAAERACLDRSTTTNGAAMVSCVGGLAPPQDAQPAIFDLWHLFRDCLYIASRQALDQMFPPTQEDYEDYVNECLGL